MFLSRCGAASRGTVPSHPRATVTAVGARGSPSTPPTTWASSASRNAFSSALGRAASPWDTAPCGHLCSACRDARMACLLVGCCLDRVLTVEILSPLLARRDPRRHIVPAVGTRPRCLAPGSRGGRCSPVQAGRESRVPSSTLRRHRWRRRPGSSSRPRRARTH
jgi:hypothetical protein